MTENELTNQIIGASIEVHRALGPGLLESAYEECLAHELSQRGIPFDGKVIVELKAVEALAPIHEAIVLTYLRMSGCKVGLLLNFNVSVLRDGIRRLVLGFEQE